MRPVITVKNLSKQYQIGNGGGLATFPTLRDKITEVLEKPVRWARIGASGLQRQASTIWALNDVSFTVNPGEVVGLIGPNGSGKSTLLKLLSRITPPTMGSAEVRGRVASLLEVGTGFHPELSGRENIYLNGAILGMSRVEIKQRFDEIVTFAGVEDFMNTPVKRYSSGMYLRLAFAVAAHLRSDVLFVDEVLTVGDMEFQRKCLGKVEGIAREGRTVILVSHNLGVVNQMCQRALWLRNGRLELDGDSRDVVAAYCSRDHLATNIWERTEETDGKATKDIVLSSVRLSQKPHETNGSFSFDLPISAQIEYEVRKPLTNLRIVIRIVSESGTIVFTSCDQDQPHQALQGMRTEGRYSSECSIPGSLLRPGKFFLTVGTNQHATWFELMENLLVFEISKAGYQLPERLGVICPILDWDIRKLDP
jgi:lipopolysaccharide transport system ATP-binding protein